MMIPHLLSLILIVPTVGLALLFLIPRKEATLARRVALASLLLPMLLSIWAFASYNPAAGGYQFVEKMPWVPSLGISLSLGIDGISSLMLLLTGIASFAGILMTQGIKDRLKEYHILFLLMIIGTYGAFLSLDIFFFYFFHEIAAIPVFLMISIWGTNHKEYAAMKLTLYLVAGAGIALVGLIGLYLATGLNSFDLVVIQNHLAAHPIPLVVQNWIFPLIVLGFGITLTLFPFHTWAPVGYAEAPTAVSMLHAGVLKKMGAYAIIRFAIQLMPEAAHTWMPVVATLAVVNIIFCGLVALVQKDIKYILAYSSCSHMGYILLGLACMNTVGLNGVVFLMFAHGVMAALAFALAGYVASQTQTRLLNELGGLSKILPFVGTCFIMVALASAGVPGFANFVAEIMVLLGAWDQYRWQTVMAVLGIVITAIYMLKAIRLGFHGPLNPKLSKIMDATTPLDKLPFVLLLAALIFVGCWPNLILKHIDSAVKPIVTGINASQELSLLETK